MVNQSFSLRSLSFGALVSATALTFACGTSSQVSDDEGFGAGGVGGTPNGATTVDSGATTTSTSGSGGAPSSTQSTTQSSSTGESSTSSGGAGGAPTTTSGETTASGQGGGGGKSQNDCCAENATPGCKEAMIEQCVCAQDSYCCQTAWDSLCVDEVTQFGCGMCVQPTTTATASSASSSSSASSGTGGGNPGKGDCCSDNPTPGCIDSMIEQCVCAQDAYCCNTKWDSICVSEVDSFQCGTCNMNQSSSSSSTASTATGGKQPPNKGLCCDDNLTSGCIDPVIEQCVCAQDSYCCDTQWDKMCAQEVDQLGCGTCQQNQQQGN